MKFWSVWRTAALRSGLAAFVVAGTVPTAAGAQQQAGAAPLVFDKVTVVDVEQGKLIPNQRVVIAGTRIQAVGAAGAVRGHGPAC